MNRGRAIVTLLLLLYLFTRLYNLTLIPIVNDEANYVYWAKITAVTNKGWFVALEGGKSPVFLWFIVFFLKILPGHLYLLAGRLPSVITGLFSLVAIYKLASFLFKSSRVGYLAALLYILCPFILLYDRLGLYDSFVTAATLWTIYFALRASIFWWGIALGLAMLSKPTALLFYGLSPLAYFFSAKKPRVTRVIFAFGLSILVNSFLIFSRGFSNYITRALGYTPSPGQILLSPLALFWQNLSLTTTWLSQLLTPPLFLLGSIFLIFLFCDKKKLALFLTTFVVLPLAVFCLTARLYFPRYFLFVTPYLLIPLAFFLAKVGKLVLPLKFVLLFILLAILIPIIRYDSLLLTDPDKAPLPSIENWQYISGHPSSYGFAPIYKYLDQQLAKGPVTLFVQGSLSHFPNAFKLYYWDQKNMRISERWPLTKIDPEMVAAKKTSQVFVVVANDYTNSRENIIKQLSLKIVVVGLKPHGPDTVYLTTFD